ncbi:hypothetical protein MQX03_03195 [Chryseobacterium aahli]|uniref:hypothetical protein n=1 Tax=Chryseobacterium aahli TaxID=1278643 RepID=UPI001F61C8CB|nr:hypothetical protein [Chryseobacterium aahli]MCI3936187.1 hypothetical protein [Chryseobacterium aahli]
MKKSLLILGLMTLFACNRESENLGVTEISNSSKPTLSKSGDIGAMFIDFLPNNLSCELGQPIDPVTTLPDVFSNFPTKVKVRTKYQPIITQGVISLPELIVKYLNDQGVTIQQILFDNNTPPSGSYFENNYYKEFTFTDVRTTIPEPDGSLSTFNIFTFNDYMENYYASVAVQNAYAKIISNMPINAKKSIKAIRIFYKDDYTCSDLQEERRNLKIQVIYKLNFATQTPVLES